MSGLEETWPLDKKCQGRDLSVHRRENGGDTPVGEEPGVRIMVVNSVP